MIDMWIPFFYSLFKFICFYIIGSFTAGDGIDQRLSSEKLEKLGWSYRPLEETLVDSVESYKQAGILD